MHLYRKKQDQAARNKGCLDVRYHHITVSPYHTSTYSIPVSLYHTSTHCIPVLVYHTSTYCTTVPLYYCITIISHYHHCIPHSYHLSTHRIHCITTSLLYNAACIYHHTSVSSLLFCSIVLPYP